MSGKIDKEYRPLVRMLRELGCDIREPQSRNNHMVIFFNGKRVGSLPTSSSDVRGRKALVTQLRRNGVPI